MIVVIADDFTGAAELAGLGLRYGLRVEIESNEISESDAELLIIATDTRSMAADEAFKHVKTIAGKLQTLPFKWLYKKTDSVLRGHVMEELHALLGMGKISRVLLVPSNPALGRRIVEGKYYINDELLHDTQFSEDPEFAITTSDVIELLQKTDAHSAKLLHPGDPLDAPGIYIGSAESENDLQKWATTNDEGLLFAGAAGFFAALLEQSGYRRQDLQANGFAKMNGNVLIVCGSTFEKETGPLHELGKKGASVCNIPENVFYPEKGSQDDILRWENNIISAFNETNVVVVEINWPVIREKSFSARLRNIIAGVVNNVMQEVTINDLIVDGGATVYAIAEQAGLNKMFPLRELAPGVIQMRIEDRENMRMTIKPGSYSWPESLVKAVL